MTTCSNCESGCLHGCHRVPNRSLSLFTPFYHWLVFFQYGTINPKVFWHVFDVKKRRPKKNWQFLSRKTPSRPPLRQHLPTAPVRRGLFSPPHRLTAGWLLSNPLCLIGSSPWVRVPKTCLKLPVRNVQQIDKLAKKSPAYTPHFFQKR